MTLFFRLLSVLVISTSLLVAGCSSGGSSAGLEKEDLDGDGIADTAYRPNDMVDQVMWAHPMAKILMNSPAIQVLRWAQSEFPSLHPGGVTDTAPLMAAPEYSKYQANLELTQ